MQFDPKSLFPRASEAPRLREDLRTYVRDLALHIARAFDACARRMCADERIAARHVKYIVLALALDPITSYNRQGLCVQNVWIKPIERVLCAAVDAALLRYDVDLDRHGGLDRRLVRECENVITARHAPTATLAIAAVVAEICGILLNSAWTNLNRPKTLDLKQVRAEGIMHVFSTGEKQPYSSFARLLRRLEGGLDASFASAPSPPLTKPTHTTEPRVTFSSDCTPASKDRRKRWRSPTWSSPH